jgi:glycosyltransferase involved in cell wall biosynthesis
LRILHISSARSWRGGEQQLAYLLEELQQLGADQEVFCAKGAPMAEFCRKKDIPCLSYPKRISADPLAGWEIRRICRIHRIDLVHVHDSHAHTAAYLAALFGNKTPIVVSRRVDFPIGKSSLSLRKYHHPSVKKILCVSEEIRRILLSSYRKPEQAAVVYSGIDPEKFRYARSGILHRDLALPERMPLIGNVAAIAPHKDYFTFVDVVEKLVSGGLEARFPIIGGDGGEQEQVEQYIRSKNLEAYILLTGHRTDIPRILPELDLLLFTSKTEGLGTSLLDAMACGVPIVATRAGGIPEIVIDGETGLLAPVGDAPQLAEQVMRAMEDEALRRQLVEGGLLQARRFSKERMARETLAQYREVLP